MSTEPSQLPELAGGYATNLIKSTLLDSGWINGMAAKPFKVRNGEVSKCFEINLTNDDV